MARSVGWATSAEVELSIERRRHVVRSLHITDYPISNFDVRVRVVPGLRGSDGVYLVDGYLGLDFFFGLFRLIAIDRRTLKLSLRPDR
jgi:hypothetical protein